MNTTTKSVKKRASVPTQIFTGLVLGACIFGVLSLFGESEPEGCLDVHSMHQNNIVKGLNDEFKGRLKLYNFSAVIAEDAIERYFVSAEIRNSASGDLFGIGTWLLRQIHAESSFYFAMPDLGTQITIYPNANEINSGVRIWNSGYKQSIRCVEWKTKSKN